jgi:hypothetical protein
MLDFLEENGCKIFICTVCPRQDVDVSPLNKMIKEICQIREITCIENNSAFIFGNGNTARQMFVRDGIHLSHRGTSTLLHNIQKSIAVIKERSTENFYRSRQADNYGNYRRFPPKGKPAEVQGQHYPRQGRQRSYWLPATGHRIGGNSRSHQNQNYGQY